MAHSFISPEEAQQILDEVRAVSEPFARGDLPCDFTIDQIFEANTKAGTLVIDLTEKVEWSLGVVDFQLYEQLRYAHSSFRTLTTELLRRDELSERDKLQLRFCQIGRESMWPAFASIEVEYV